ncbi:hypothetical protein K505DRAFT_245312 [Melanomma pulvis-pyrius CBS 109.77]|uniref:Protein with SprT-like domain at the N terminus n=1 Tax=Melanomma pulvis-pyrius CBS 109.77 TaxID=1314802 RepID=A0A6A6X9F7_9PLEO|nr:hypothetical protein K505DRAFT_245312 [Melanomma pulvis-pyrius CBS 109.77]
MPVTDEDAAMAAILSLETLTQEQQEALAAVSKILHNDEPFVDIHELFGHYNVLYFRNLLVPRVEVLWSPRLTLCAGICELSKDASTGKFTRIRLKMSTPLLQYRPRADTVDTLLHEAIHAYFFITTSWQHLRGDDGTGHGLGFQLLADAINNHGNYEITIYHTFHDEVESYRTHVWQCDGPCKQQEPYFGLVKRSMNRAPGKSDTWWARHEIECGGTYKKIQEPEPTKKQREAMSKKERAGRQKNKLDSWVKVEGSKEATAKSGSRISALPVDANREDGTSNIASSGKRKAEVIIIDDVVDIASPFVSKPRAGQKRPRNDAVYDDEILVVEKKVLVECPICSVRIAETEINEHLDVVHP